MHEYASNTQEARELLADLEYLWNQIKNIEPTKSPSTDSTDLSGLPPTTALPGLLGYSSGGGGSASISRRSHPGKSRRRGDIATISGSSIYGLGGGAGGGGSGSLGTRSVGGASSISGGANRRMKFVQQQDPEEKWRRDVTWALETINEEILAMRHRYDAVVTGAPPAGPSPGASVPLEMLAQAGSSVQSYRITPHSTILGPPLSQGAAASVYSYSGRHHIKPNIDLPLQHHASQVISGKGSHGGSARDDDDDSFPNKIKLLVQIIQQICRKRIFRLLLNISTRIFIDLAVLRGLLFIYQFLATKKRGRVDGIMGSLIEKLFSVEIKYL